MKKLIVLAVVLLGFTASSYAQFSAVAQISANMISPTSIKKNLNLDFGNVYTPSVVTVGTSTTFGTVKVLTQENPYRVSTDVILAPGNSGQAAKFTLIGPPGSTASLSLPVFTPITLSSGIDFMNVTLDFTNPGLKLVGNNGTFTFDNTGSYSFFVGGTLQVAPNQTWGSYSNVTDLEVIINQ